MSKAVRIFYMVLGTAIAVALLGIAFCAVFALLKGAPSKTSVAVDYNSFVSVLLTTITVIFTVSGVALALIGIWGYQNIKRDAGRYAESQALEEISKAFELNGRGTARIVLEMQNENGHHRQFLERRIRTEIIELLPLIADRINAEALSFAFDEPTDQGDVS